MSLVLIFSFFVSEVSAVSSDSLLNAYKNYISQGSTPTVPTPVPVIEKISPPIVAPVVNTVVAPALPTVPPKIITPPTTSAPITNVSETTLTSALQKLLSKQEFVDQLRGSQGPQGNTGPQGPAGPTGLTTTNPNSYPAIVYTAPPNPAANFSGASFFSATNLSSNEFTTNILKGTTLTISGIVEVPLSQEV